ncbi:MAG: hypothetical protein JNN22_10115 [Rhodospirillales bacterium]|nr:hypothetical protein [Rhodospirillales bacterium]
MADLAQFIRSETHPLERSTLSGKSKRRGTGRKGWNARDIRNEAERRPEAIPHINQPEAPILIYGVTPTKVIERITKEVAKRRVKLLETAAKGGKVRRIRKDQHVMISGVAGYPVDWKTIRDDPTAAANLSEWKKDVVAFLVEHYAKAGGELASVVEHVDEPYPHLHFYVLPVGSPTFAAREVHDGWQPKLEARRANLGKVKEDAAYRQGTESLQDVFYIAVSQKHGHARHKEKRPRVARSLFVGQKRELAYQNKLLAKTRQVADRKQAQLTQKEVELAILQREIDGAQSEINIRIAAIEAQKADFQRRELAIQISEENLALALERTRSSERDAVAARQMAKKAEAAFRQAAKDVLPTAQTTLESIKLSIRGLIKIRDRNRQAQSPAEAQSFAVARSTIEALEKTALALDTFLCVKDPVMEHGPDAEDLESAAVHYSIKPD